MDNKKITIELEDGLTGLKIRGETSIKQIEEISHNIYIDPLRLLLNKLTTELNREIHILNAGKLNYYDMGNQVTFLEGTLVKEGDGRPLWYSNDKHNLSLSFGPTYTTLHKETTGIMKISSLNHLKEVYEILTNQKFN